MTHLAYAPEIAQSMLRRQQAEALARRGISVAAPEKRPRGRPPKDMQDQ